jgi:hypothetical protein
MAECEKIGLEISGLISSSFAVGFVGVVSKRFFAERLLLAP